MDVEFQVLRSVYLESGRFYYGVVLRIGYRSNRGHFEGSKKIVVGQQAIPYIHSCSYLKEPLKTLKMFRLEERRRHRNMVAVVSCSDSLWTST